MLGSLRVTITPNIQKDPYQDKEFMEMGRKLNSLCSKNFSFHYLCILKKELESIDNQNKKLFNRKIEKELKDRMSEYAQHSPCAEIFYNSIFSEIAKSLKNQPLSHVLHQIEKLTLMSKNLCHIG